MSDLPGEMTKQILSAPARIMRSSRYSLTAHGRSTPPSMRLPTGNSSLEKASGWMRLPRPAAGMMPHMVSGLRQQRGIGAAGRLDHREEIVRTVRGGVLREHALAASLGNTP